MLGAGSCGRPARLLSCWRLPVFIRRAGMRSPVQLLMLVISILNPVTQHGVGVVPPQRRAWDRSDAAAVHAKIGASAASLHPPRRLPLKVPEAPDAVSHV